MEDLEKSGKDHDETHPTKAHKPSPIVQELCKKLKLQLDQLGVVLQEEAPSEDLSQRKDLFQALQKQLAELSR